MEAHSNNRYQYETDEPDEPTDDDLLIDLPVNI